LLLGNGNHLFQAFRKYPIVGKYDLAVFAFSRDLSQGAVEICHGAEEFIVPAHANSRILCGVLARYFGGSVGAAVIDNYAFPVLMRLREDALNALADMLSLIVRGNDHADHRLMCGIHALEPVKP
jgi:hypothetical protein